MREQWDIIKRAVLGTAAPFAGLSVSLTEVELWLRIASLVIGICVGIASLIHIIKQSKKP